MVSIREILQHDSTCLLSLQPVVISVLEMLNLRSYFVKLLQFQHTTGEYNLTYFLVNEFTNFWLNFVQNCLETFDQRIELTQHYEI